MRASRLLQILLLLQNRGRMSAPLLARELEVAPRTILRDVDALTEAGLPIITFRGVQGGIELGFNYRTRLTGLAADEVEALALWLAVLPPALVALKMEAPARRARSKLIESLPDTSRRIVEATRRQISLESDAVPDPDPRIAAIAAAIRNGLTLTLQARTRTALRLRPEQLGCGADGWWVAGPPAKGRIRADDWGDINISRAPVDLPALPT